ncbi:MAG: RluA family pseudouridine synthase [Opitutales bacterium]
MSLHWREYPAWRAEPDQVDPAELPAWIVHEDEDVLALNKPPWLVCHPSKHGPWSSLVGAVKAHTGMETLHLVSRLDRETSGLVLLAKHKAAARTYQMALQERHVRKGYLALLEGEFTQPETVDLPLGPDAQSPVAVKQTWGSGRGFQAARTRFEPVAQGGGFTFCRVDPETGRKHQIRAHAQVLGHPVAGDKLYGPDPLLYLEFIDSGWTERHAQLLSLRRQALHCETLEFDLPSGPRVFHAPLFEDLRSFVSERISLAADAED